MSFVKRLGARNRVVVMVLGLVGGLAACKTLAKHALSSLLLGRVADLLTCYAYYRKKTRGLALKRKRSRKK